jgi:ribulose 1,5-bisphosphate synthetase/thiazole synthase
MNPINRRAFLKSSALSVPAAAGATGFLAATAAAATSEKPELASGGKTYRLTREIPVEEGYDLVVAGGGPAGAAAAICAARLGAKVLLIEATGCMGGMGTNALVSNWYALGDGQRLAVGGLIVELIEKLCRGNHVSPTTYENFQKGTYLGAVGFDPEALKILFDELCVAAGVEVRFFTRVIDADANPQQGRVQGVVTNSVEGYRYIRAKAFIDATGDAILSELCGAKSRAAGRDTPNIMPPTLCAAIADLDYERYHNKLQQAAVERAIADNFFTQADRHVPGLMRNGLTTATMNAGHLFHADALKTRSLSEAVMHGRRLVQEYAAFYRKYLPGCEKIEVMSTGNLLGVRESRRVVGEYELNYADFQARRHFPDQIAVYCKGVDIHVYDLSAAEYQRYHEEYTKLDKLKRGESYGIPYGVLVPKGWANLWVAGRCVSCDIKVQGAIRDQPGCSMMGQAAGTAAVQSIRTGQPANELDTEQLVLTLRKAGAHLPQPQTSKTMTRTG